VGFLGLPRLAGATPVTENTIDLTFTNVASPISSAFISLFSTNGSLASFDGYAPLQAIPAGGSTQTVVLNPAAESTTVPAGLGGVSPDLFAIAGVYTSGTGDAAVQGLTVGVNTTEAAALNGLSYTQAFPAGTHSEAQVVAFLKNPDLSLLPISLQAYVNKFAGQLTPALISTDDGTGDLVNFSNATISGTVNATLGTATVGPPVSSVPLPSAAWSGLALLSGLAGIAALRRKLSCAA